MWGLFKEQITVLIVEDQLEMRQRLRTFVQSAYPDTNILEAADGSSALALCRERRPRVVLMDIQLPDADGIELTAKVRTMLPNTAVIIVSSYKSDVYVERAMAAGACAYVTKDLAYKDLLPAIKKALNREQDVNDQKESQ